MHKFFKKSLVIIPFLAVFIFPAISFASGTITYWNYGVAHTVYIFPTWEANKIIRITPPPACPTNITNIFFQSGVQQTYPVEFSGGYYSFTLNEVNVNNYGSFTNGMTELDCGSDIAWEYYVPTGGGEGGGQPAGMFSVATTTASSFVGVAKEVIADEGTGKIVAMFAGIIVALYIIHNVIEFFPRNKKRKKK